MINLIYNIVIIPALWIARSALKLINPHYAKREKIAFDFLASPVLSKFKKEQHVWFHASSMGEFEQAKPVIEELKASIPDIYITCSFYSPSGYENQKKYEFADQIVYMPFDTRRNARMFLDKINPSCAIFVRYDFWLNHLKELERRGMPAFLICATKPGNFKVASKFPLNLFYKKIYSLFATIWTVDKEQTEYIRSYNSAPDLRTLSDTRLDRIARQVEKASQNPIIPRGIFEQEDFILVVGSSWEEDEILIAAAVKKMSVKIKKNLKIIFVPHVPSEDNIARVKKLAAPSLTYTEMEPMLKEGNVTTLRETVSGRNIVIDKVGLLLRLYHVADAAFIGCGFGDGIHSVSEPAGFGIPTAGGPNINKSPDAVELHRRGSFTIINDEDDMRIWLEKVVENQLFRENTGRLAQSYVMESLGASKTIADEIAQYLGETVE